MANSKPLQAEDRHEELRTLLDAALDTVEEAMVVLDGTERVVVWNRSAEAITGQRRAERLGLPLPEHWLRQAHRRTASGESGFSGVGSGKGHFYTGALPLADHSWQDDPARLNGKSPDHAVLVEMTHAMGHALPVMLRRAVLRDELGGRIGVCFRFYSAEDFDRLPHGEGSDGARVSQAQAEMEEWLEEAFRAAETTSAPFGVLWMTVDQGHSLRRTHGRDACEEMMQAVEHALRHALRPSEMLGRWGESEFLIVSHERSPELLADHAHRLAGQVRTVDFRWWGDRIGLTLSVGVAEWHTGCALAELLARAQSAMQASVFAGGNQVSRAHADSGAGSQS